MGAVGAGMGAVGGTAAAAFSGTAAALGGAATEAVCGNQLWAFWHVDQDSRVRRESK